MNEGGWKDGRMEGRKGGREEGRKVGRKGGRKLTILASFPERVVWSGGMCIESAAYGADGHSAVIG